MHTCLPNWARKKRKANAVQFCMRSMLDRKGLYVRFSRQSLTSVLT